MQYIRFTRFNTHLALCTLFIASTVFGQDDLLKGPDLDSMMQTTIVQRTMMGEFTRVEGRPEMAAFRAVINDPSLNDQAITIELERTIAFSMLLVDEIELMKESTDAMLAGDQKKAREIQGQMHTIFDPTRRHDPLSPELIDLLNEEQAAEYGRVLEEYWEAWIDWVLRKQMNFEKKAVRDRARDRLTVQLFQRELTEAYEISLRQYRDAMDAIYNSVHPTEEQRSAIRDLVIEHIKATRLDATPEQRREVMHSIYQMLDEERRVKLFDYLLRFVVPDGSGQG